MRAHVDLFSGIGGFSLAARWAGVETIAFAEIDSYANRVLERHFPGVGNYGDVRNVPAIEGVWLVTGGVPCQPASVAGKRQGADDDRWLWPEALTAVERIRPAWVLFENPTGILSLNDGVEFERICTSLEGQGYEVQPLVIPACGVGAPHRRNRVWIVAHDSRDGCRERRAQRFDSGGEREREPIGLFQNVAHSERRGRRESTDAIDSERESLCTTEWEESALELGSSGEDVAHAVSKQLRAGRHGEIARTSRATESGEEERQRFWVNAGECGEDVSDANGRRRQQRNAPIGRVSESQPNGNGFRGDWWSVEPNMGRLADGVSDRVGKLRCLGNAIVPQVAYQLIKRMIEADER